MLCRLNRHFTDILSLRLIFRSIMHKSHPIAYKKYQGIPNMTIQKWPESRQFPKAFLRPPTTQEIAALPNCGLPYSITRLKKLEDVMWHMEDSILAKYADYVTRGSLNTSWFADLHMAEYLTGILPDSSITKVAEVMYVAQNCANVPLKARATAAAKSWRTSYIAKYIPECSGCQNPFSFGQRSHMGPGGCLEKIDNDLLASEDPVPPPEGLKHKSLSLQGSAKRQKIFHEELKGDTDEDTDEDTDDTDDNDGDIDDTDEEGEIESDSDSSIKQEKITQQDLKYEYDFNDVQVVS